jgi:hypothetical protein
MVCYARPASRFAAFLIVALVVFGRPVGHFLGTAAILVAALAAAGGAAVAAAFVLAAFASTRRQRAAAGGCVTCQFRCQHAMTAPSRRPWLVTTADRQEPGLAHPARTPHPRHPARTPSSGHPGPVLLPIPAIRPAGATGAGGAGGAAGAARSVRPPGAVEAAGVSGVTRATPHWPDQPLRHASGQQDRVRSPA